MDPKAAELIKFAVNLAIGHEYGAKLHLYRARRNSASVDEVWKTVAYAVRPVAAKVRNFAKNILPSKTELEVCHANSNCAGPVDRAAVKA